jgi:UDP-N-acetylmuramoylalanine--D-glutamate ligase
MSDLIASSRVVLIVGLGVTGLSVARFLARQGQRFMVADANLKAERLSSLKAEFPDVRVLNGEFDYEQWLGVSEIILSPGVPRKHPAIVAALADDIPVIGDIELFARYARAPVIAITGSNGKTTVTTLVGEMALEAGKRVAVGGNIGTPALDLLADHVDLYVLELSSFQLESTSSLKPLAATILNISDDHMDRYDSLQQYHIAKQRVYFGCTHIVVNRDDLLTHPPLNSTAKVIRFGSSEPDLKDFGLREEDGCVYLAQGLRNLLPVSELLIRGRHNQLNALSALALGRAAELDEVSMLRALTKFKGLPHRCQFVATKNQITYVNDSKATNVGATQAALAGLGGKQKNIVLIAGGEGKGADFSPLKEQLTRNVKALVTIGTDGEKIAQICAGELPVTACTSLAEAVQTATEYAQPGDIVLLAPACASFDMFLNYQDRGNQFCALVEGLCQS